MKLSSMIIKNLCVNPSAPCIGTKINNNWAWYSKKDISISIHDSIQQLNELNIKKGDRVAFKGKNSLEWISWNLATNSIGAIWVPMYENQSESYCNYIIENCRPKILLTNDNKIEKLKENKDIQYNSINDDISTLIYTSGTTGYPKGVMLSNKNILSNTNSIHKRFNNIGPYTSLNILPWAHIYSQTCELYYNMLNDNKTAISSSRENFIKECREINPDVLYLVPRVLELIKDKASKLDAPLLRSFIPLFLNYLFGGKLKYIFTGGAKLNGETRDFFTNYGYIICEGYGCTETSPMISVNHFQEPRDVESIGKVLDDIIVEIVDNEIQISGDNVMMGYWNDEKSTNNVLVNRDKRTWYKTGDSGILENGFLYYKGRINDNYKLSNGKFVNVQCVEETCKKHLNDVCVVFGENMNNNELITINHVSNKKLNEINSEMDSYLKIKKIHNISNEELSQFLTPKMSIKRKQLIDYVLNKFK